MIWISHPPFSLFIIYLSIYRFRSEYRLERKLLSELSSDDEDDETTKTTNFSITRVMVLYNDKLQTLTSNNDYSFDNDSFWQGSLWY